MDKPQLSESKLQEIKEELKTLIEVERPKAVSAIEEARAHGDLKENAEYHEARAEQGKLEDRIKELQYLVSHAVILETADTDSVALGHKVTLIKQSDSSERVYMIVGEEEADLSAGKISFTSPIAKALIGKQVGEVATITTPGGTVDFEVKDISN